MFGVTGDLARKKLMPAIYDLANRGLLPPGFSLVGFARRDWEDEDSSPSTCTTRSSEHARTPFREEVWRQLAEGIRFVPGSFDDDEGFEAAQARPSRAGRAPGHRRQPRVLPVDPAGRLRPGHASSCAPRPGRASTRDDAWNRVVIEKPFGHDLASARSSTTTSRASSSGLGVPHRPLPGQGDGAEPAGAALRQPAVRADLERRYVDHVQITMAEDIGIGGRAGYYDGIGAPAT
jgi:glucose-6-phosphate 1-dehydrogenase